ncbi:TadE/TadG family type IV pilus assembly protein [Rodentibacter caecimuris]|uniref:Protein TadE n=1 Tax=Rodentibacter caecimuris TaxID=1796644 RepID=A0ABX3KYG6_9PAST|nr:protein TadE [Rodentibacter heylii]
MKKFFSNIKGVSTVEFSFTIALYFFVVMLILEFCRLVIVTSYWDLAIAESVRIAKNENVNSTGNYEEAFRKALKEQRKLQGESTVGYLAQVQKNDFDISVKYVDCDVGRSCISALLDEKFRVPKKDNDGKLISPNGKEATLARYSLSYDYEFLVPLPFFPKSWTQSLLNREFVVVQEYERSQFN